MELLANAGFVSPYFITDPERAICRMTAPSVLACTEELSLDGLAFGISQLASPKKSKRKSMWASATPPVPWTQDAVHGALMQIIEKGVSAEPLELPRPLLVLALKVEKAALAPLLVLKMRGQLQSLAIQFSTADHQVIEMVNAFASVAQPVPGGEVLFTFEHIHNLCVLSGVNATAFSTEANTDELISKYPGIARDKPLSEEEYLFYERQ